MTIPLIAITVIISALCFTNHSLFDKLLFNPYKVYHKKEYYRLITHVFVHADWIHLIVNMFVLYSFGQAFEYYMGILQTNAIVKFNPVVYYLLMYFIATIVASLTTLKKYKDVSYYNSVGASGAVSAVVFACIFFEPWQMLYVWFIPVPGIIFGVLYLLYSQYMGKKSQDNVNHDAHFLGALFGFTFPILLNPQLFYVFLKQLFNFHL